MPTVLILSRDRNQAAWLASAVAEQAGCERRLAGRVPESLEGIDAVLYALDSPEEAAALGEKLPGRVLMLAYPGQPGAPGVVLHLWPWAPSELARSLRACLGLPQPRRVCRPAPRLRQDRPAG
ncbi:MAG TPA: hypothetical protein VNO81_06200 [Candidatus Nitrosotenuis sp.]|nr:hypothetical protein [Candidatus Nitrosotenuis sp.]